MTPILLPAVLAALSASIRLAADAFALLARLPEMWRAVGRERERARGEVERLRCAHAWCCKDAVPGDRICAEHRAAYERDAADAECRVPNPDDARVTCFRPADHSGLHCGIEAGGGTVAWADEVECVGTRCVPETRPLSDMTDDEVEAELRRDGVDVDAFVARMREAVADARRRAANPPIHDPAALDAEEQATVAAWRTEPLHFYPRMMAENLCGGFKGRATMRREVFTAEANRCPECYRRAFPTVDA